MRKIKINKRGQIRSWWRAISRGLEKDWTSEVASSGRGSLGNEFSKNKKGQIFTIIAIVLIILVFLSFEIFSFLHEGKSIRTRVSTMDAFLSSIEQNLERQIYISGFRIIFLAEDKITSTGRYINVDNFFNEAFFNGTIGGQEPNNSILVGATYNDLINSVNYYAEKINVEIILENSTLVVSQSDPWNVNVTLISNFLMIDKNNLARWEKVQKISAFIPITYFEDPLFTVNSYARISRKINQTIYEGNYVNGSDVSNLLDHVNQGYYAANSFAPSFLNRLEGDLSADENGIESFVNIPEFSAQELPTHDKTTIDYLYFSSENPPSHNVEGMPSWFKIDYEHDAKYGLGGTGGALGK